MSQFPPTQALDQKAANTAHDEEACELGDALKASTPARNRQEQESDKGRNEGARISWCPRVFDLESLHETIATSTQLDLSSEQQDHKERQ